MNKTLKAENIKMFIGGIEIIGIGDFSIKSEDCQIVEYTQEYVNEYLLNMRKNKEEGY